VESAMVTFPAAKMEPALGDIAGVAAGVGPPPQVPQLPEPPPPQPARSDAANSAIPSRTRLSLPIPATNLQLLKTPSLSPRSTVRGVLDFLTTCFVRVWR